MTSIPILPDGMEPTDDYLKACLVRIEELTFALTTGQYSDPEDNEQDVAAAIVVVRGFIHEMVGADEGNAMIAMRLLVAGLPEAEKEKVTDADMQTMYESLHAASRAAKVSRAVVLAQIGSEIRQERLPYTWAAIQGAVKTLREKWA